MLDWLRRFFQSDDPVVKVAYGLLETEAQMMRDALRDGGIPAFAKNMQPLSGTYHVGWFGNNYALFVKESDLERARELLEPLLTPAQLMREEGEQGNDEGPQPDD